MQPDTAAHVPASETAPGCRPRVLVVDDDPALVAFLSDYLAQAHPEYDVLTASTGEAGVEMTKQWHPDVVLLDITMPGIGGLQALKQIRELVPGLPVIMVTGLHDPDVLLTTLKSGAFGCMPKPFDPARLGQLIALALRKRPDGSQTA